MTTTLVARATAGRFHQLDAVSPNVDETLQGLARLASGGGRVGEGRRSAVEESQVVGFPKQVGVVPSRVEVLSSHYEVGTEVAA